MNKVAVLIPTYNRSRYVRECIESMLNQTHGDIVVVVYDDGSTDNTLGVASSIMDSRINTYNGIRNNGIVYARNWLLDKAEQLGVDYACWQDSDDVSSPHRIKMQLDALREQEQPVVYSGFEVLRDQRYRTEVPGFFDETAAFATALFKVGQVPRFVEIKRNPTPTTIGGEDVVWRDELKAKHGQEIVVRKVLYWVRRHQQRISIWRHNPHLNPDWHKRMLKRVN